MSVHTYTVGKGESAQSVSEKFSVSRAALQRENHTPFYEGQQITVPVGILTLPAGSRPGAGYYQVPGTAIFDRQDAVNIIFL